MRHGSNAGHSSGVPGVDARRATPPDPRLARWGLAGCLQPDPSHPALVTREDPGVEPCRSCQPFLPDRSTSLAQSTCRAARFPRVNEHTPAHHRSAWATRGLASHPELPKMVGTIPIYIVYDNVTQCFGHEPLPGAMRFSQKPNNRLHWLRAEGPGTFRLQGNVSGHCRLMGAQSLTCLEYFLAPASWCAMRGRMHKIGG